MKRVASLGVLLSACLLASVIEARAGDWWDAMEAWSGPGPYGHRFGNYLMNVCRDHQKQEKGFRIAREATEDRWREPCVYFNFAGYRADADATKGYDAVDLRSYDFGLMFEIRYGVDVGFGTGWISTESKGKSSRKWSVTPIRVAIRPLCFVVDCSFDESRKPASHWARVWTVYLREVWLPKGVSSADFNAPEVNYKVDYDLISSAGLLVIDVGELIAALKVTIR